VITVHFTIGIVVSRKLRQNARQWLKAVWHWHRGKNETDAWQLYDRRTHTGRHSSGNAATVKAYAEWHRVRRFVATTSIHVCTALLWIMHSTACI